MRLRPVGYTALRESHKRQSNNLRCGPSEPAADEQGVYGSGNAPEKCGHLKFINPDLGHSHPALVCALDATTTIIGDCDGSLTVLTVKNGNFNTFFSHKGPVRALDAWAGHVVSVGVDRVMRVFRCSGKSLEQVASTELLSIPADIKLVKMEKKLCVTLVEEHVPACLVYYALEGSLTVKRRSTYLGDTGSDLFVCREISLNVSRTHYAVIGKCGSCVRVIVGTVGISHVSDALCFHGGQNHYSFKWGGDPNDVFWVTGDNGFTKCLRPVKREFVRPGSCHERASR